jgi:hypothetical protein
MAYWQTPPTWWPPGTKTPRQPRLRHHLRWEEAPRPSLDLTSWACPRPDPTPGGHGRPAVTSHRRGTAPTGPLRSQGPLSCSRRLCTGLHPVEKSAAPSHAPALRSAPRCLTYAWPYRCCSASQRRSGHGGALLRAGGRVRTSGRRHRHGSRANVKAIGAERRYHSPAYTTNCHGKKRRTHRSNSLSGPAPVCPPLSERKAARGSRPTLAGDDSIWPLHSPGPLSCSRCPH